MERERRENTYVLDDALARFQIDMRKHLSRRRVTERQLSKMKDVVAIAKRYFADKDVIVGNSYFSDCSGDELCVTYNSKKVVDRYHLAIFTTRGLVVDSVYYKPQFGVCPQIGVTRVGPYRPKLQSLGLKY